MNKTGKFADPANRELALRMYADGNTKDTIGKHFGLSPSHVYRWLKRMGVYRKCRPQDRPQDWPQYVESPWTAEMWDRVRALYDEGLPISAIAKCAGLKKNQVSGRLWRCGCFRRCSAQSSTVHIRLDTIDVFPPIGSCLWPSGDPGSPDFHFCGSPQTRIERDGKSIPAAYCQTHWDAAYRPLVAKDRQFIRKLVRVA